MFTQRRILFVVLFIWLWSTLFSLPLLTASRYFEAYHRLYNKKVPVCYQVFNSNWLLNYLFVSLALFYLMPCILLCILYFKIMFALRNRRREKLTETSQNHEVRVSLSETSSHTKHSVINSTVPKINEKQIIILLIIMMLLVLICLLPIRVFTVWFALASKEQRQSLGIINYSILLTFCRVLFYLNSVLNPIFYHFMSSKFQIAFKKFFKRQT